MIKNFADFSLLESESFSTGFSTLSEKIKETLKFGDSAVGPNMWEKISMMSGVADTPQEYVNLWKKDVTDLEKKIENYLGKDSKNIICFSSDTEGELEELEDMFFTPLDIVHLKCARFHFVIQGGMLNDVAAEEIAAGSSREIKPDIQYKSQTDNYRWGIGGTLTFQKVFVIFCLHNNMEADKSYEKSMTRVFCFVSPDQNADGTLASSVVKKLSAPALVALKKWIRPEDLHALRGKIGTHRFGI